MRYLWDPRRTGIRTFTETQSVELLVLEIQESDIGPIDNASGFLQFPKRVLNILRELFQHVR